MKKKLLIVFSITALIVFGLLINTNNTNVSEMDKLREQHIAFLDNSPFKATDKLSKKERKLNGLPPNKYMERQWELTMDPEDGVPHPERTFLLQKNLSEQFNKVPGENSNDWVERGPNNIGGRTRAIMYDPNDNTNKRVFAGGVSGGLWVNDDITNASSAWTQVGIPKNLAISCITYDPNDTDIFYVGTGESYVFDSVNGNGVWQSTDGGVTWSQIFGGVTGDSEFQANAKVTVNTPAGISGEYPVILATAFGDQLGSPVAGDLVLVQDSTGTSEDACEALTNSGAIAGKIAVIRRGDCSFVDKINRAQVAGAIGVIMVNNIGGNPISMGGTDAGITIPNVMISRDLGNIIIAELGNGVNATMELSGDLLSGNIVAGVQHINDIKVKDIGGGNSEVYVGVGSNGFYDSNPRSYLGLEESGLYMSDDEGVSFSKLALGNAASGLPLNPNDIEISVDGTIWVSTIANRFFGDGGGLIFSSTDGITFTQAYAVSGAANRTQIAVSGTNAGTLFVLSYRGGTDASPVFIANTVNAFGRVSNMSQPNSIDNNIPNNDFSNTQGWFDLYLEVDPTDDNILYVGGIDIFRSGDGGLNWNQISEAYTGTSLSNVHPDQHTIVFNPSNPNKAVFGNDGGIFYSDDLANAASSSTGLTSRNNNYNVTQFYKGAIGQEVANEKFLAGAQDNNSLLLNNATAGINSATITQGGDGAYAFIDRDNEYMVTSSQNGYFTRRNYSTGAFTGNITPGSVGGQFINPAALDSDNDILYIDGTIGTTTYQILRYSNIDATPSAGVALSNALLVRNPTAFKTSTFTTTTLFVGTDDSKLLKLTNADTASPTWSDISGPDFVGSISCIELGASENDIYVTFYNYGVTSVFYSPDGGTTWSNKEGGLPDFPVRAILANPLNADEVIIGTELGVWATNNFSSATPVWHQAQNGMKDVQVTSFDLRTADNTVLASTYGRGMFTGLFTADASGLSVDEFSENDLIRIYPTVSNGEITISSISEVREGVINVFDINGRNVHISKVNFDGGLEHPISLNLSSGMYVVKFSANKLQSSHKIIIK